MTGDPLRVLTIGPFPAADDPAVGRFVADQVAALVTCGEVVPEVVAFDKLPLVGDEHARADQEAAIAAGVAAAILEADPFSARGAAGPDGVRVARLAIANGPAARRGDADSAVRRRLAALEPFAARMGRQWDLVHAHVGYPEGVAAAALAKRLGLPLVVTEHASTLEATLGDDVPRRGYLSMVARAARLVAVSETLARELRRDLRVAEGKLVVIPNAVDIDAFELVGPDRRDPDELLFVGFRKASKGIERLLRALALARARRPGLRLTLIGSAPTAREESSWVALAAGLGITDAVRFEPTAGRGTVSVAMARAGLLVHPSPRETFGIVVAEALASGLPVVATHSGGVDEILAPDPAPFGALVDGETSEALAAAILDTLDRRETFDAAAMRAHVAGRYGSKVVARQVATLYREVVRAQPTDPAALEGLQTTEGARPGARRRVIVGFQRPILDRLIDGLPVALHGIAVVTSGAPGAGLTVAEAGTAERITELARWDAPSAAGRPLSWRVRRVLLTPLRWVRRARRRAWLESALGSALGPTIRLAVNAISSHGDGRPAQLVCVSGIDVVAAQPLVDEGLATIAPGGLRWLADRLGTKADQPPSVEMSSR